MDTIDSLVDWWTSARKQSYRAFFAHQWYDYLLADKAYDIDQFRKNLRDHGIEAVIPSKRNRLFSTSHDKHIYKERNAVERFFQKIKRHRRIVTRYDKTSKMDLI